MDRNLATLLMIAKTGNMTAAAEKLFITQPTLTKRLQQLEQAYAAKLVERLPRGARLTQLGEALLPFAKKIEQTYLQASEALDAVQDGHLDEIRVGAGPLFHMRYLGKVFEALRKEFPNTRIRVTADVNSRNLPKIREGRQHLMFGTTENLDPDDEVQFIPLTVVEQGVLVGVDHPLAIQDGVHARDLRDVSWIVYSDTLEYEEMTTAYFALQGLKPPIMVLQTSSFALGLQMVESSGLAMTVPVQLAPILDSERYKVLMPDPPISRKPAGAFYRSSSIAFPIVNRLIELVQEQIAER